MRARTRYSLLDVLRKTLRRSGVPGLYQGWESQILKGLLSHGLTSEFASPSSPPPSPFRALWALASRRQGSS
jgi:hypothetical protein